MGILDNMEKITTLSVYISTNCYLLKSVWHPPYFEKGRVVAWPKTASKWTNISRDVRWRQLCCSPSPLFLLQLSVISAYYIETIAASSEPSLYLSVLGMGCEFYFVAALSLRYSTQSLNVPYFIVANTTSAAHSVCAGSTIFWVSNFSVLAFLKLSDFWSSATRSQMSGLRALFD